MIEPLLIGDFHVGAPVLLAPMAGVTDLPFRRQACGAGASYTVSEMVAGDQLARARPDMVRRAAGAGSVSPLVIQLAGREAQWMTRGAALAEDAGADIIDINMGCPSKSVTSGLSGSALMRDPEHALRLIEATVAGTKRPVTLKMRLGWDHGSMNAPEIALRAAAAGVQMIVVHGRTRCDFFRGRADWSAIRAVVDAVRVPVIANGDICSASDARIALTQSGARGVMVGRGAQGRPWLPAALARALDEGGEAQAPPPHVVGAMVRAIVTDSLEFYGAYLGLRIARKHVAWALEATDLGLSPAETRALRAHVCTLEAPRAVLGAIENIFVEGRRAAA